VSWAERHGASGIDSGFGVAVDPWNNVVLGGYFHDSVDFGAGLLVSQGQMDGFVLRRAP